MARFQLLFRINQIIFADAVVDMSVHVQNKIKELLTKSQHTKKKQEKKQTGMKYESKL